jgi:hypothetical protein
MSPGEQQAVQPYYGLPLMTPEMRRYRVGGRQMMDPRNFEYARQIREKAAQGTRLKKGGEVKGGKNWIQGAIKKPGALRAQMGVKAGQKIPAKKLAAAAKAPGKLGQRARFAQTLSKMKRK